MDVFWSNNCGVYKWQQAVSDYKIDFKNPDKAWHKGF